MDEFEDVGRGRRSEDDEEERSPKKEQAVLGSGRTACRQRSA